MTTNLADSSAHDHARFRKALLDLSWSSDLFKTWVNDGGQIGREKNSFSRNTQLSQYKENSCGDSQVNLWGRFLCLPPPPPPTCRKFLERFIIFSLDRRDPQITLPAHAPRLVLLGRPENTGCESPVSLHCLASPPSSLWTVGKGKTTTPGRSTVCLDERNLGAVSPRWNVVTFKTIRPHYCTDVTGTPKICIRSHYHAYYGCSREIPHKKRINMTL